MNWYKKAQENKILYIMRGISGSGKSSIAKQLANENDIFSTDDFFTIEGKYQYDPSMIGHAHQWNQARVSMAMKKGISPIVVDNTNIEAWEAKPYVEEGLKQGYQIEVVETNTPWKFNSEELAKRNKHGVPKEVIEDMIKKWDTEFTVDDILKSEKNNELV